MNIAAIVAVDKNWAIGRAGGLLCHLPADLKHFKSVTMGYPIIMGRKTFESFPRGPLPGRLNIVLTHNSHYDKPGVVLCHGIDDALSVAKAYGKDRCFVIGGGKVYAGFAGLYDELFLTQIDACFDDADTFFPEIDAGQWEEESRTAPQTDAESGIEYEFVVYRRKPYNK